MTDIIANYDEPWKEAISEYFDYFLEFFFPEVYNLINWSKKPVSLDQELQKITADSQDSKRLVDKLFQVWLKDDREVWILVHIEVQSQYDSDFTERMFIYHYRIFDLYRKPVISLAILGDESKTWRPSNYSYDLGGCKLNLDFPVIKLLDYQEKWSELATNLNPFAMIIMAHLKTKATTSNLTEREQWKWTLIRSLYDKNYSKLQIVKLFKFIDLMMTLPKNLQLNLNEKIIKYEEGKIMPLISPFEQMAIEKTLYNNIISILQKRFETVPNSLTKKIKDFTDNDFTNIEELQKLLLETISVNSLDEFENLLDTLIQE